MPLQSNPNSKLISIFKVSLISNQESENFFSSRRERRRRREMDDVDDHAPRISCSNCVNGVLEKANFSRISNEEKLDIIRRFQNNPRFDELDLYYLGLLDEEEESSKEKKIPKGSSETKPSMKNLDRLPFLKKIPKGKRSKMEKRKAVVDVVLEDRSTPEAEAAETLLLFKNAALNQNHPPPLEEELTNNKKKKMKIIMSGKAIDIDCCRPIDDISGPKKKKKRPRTDDQQQEAEQDRAKKIKLMAPPPPPPEVPPKLKTRIEELGGSQVMLVIEKELFPTDVTAGNGRFSLPLTKINPDFLIPQERQFLGGKSTATGLPKPQIQTQLIQPCGEECTINLREWHMKSPIYNLVTKWNDVVKTNSLRKGMIVQLWSFRVASHLRLALVEAGKDIQ